MMAAATTAAGKALLVLDLDETLIRAGGDELVAADFTVAGYRVVKRPFVDHFLATVSGWYDVAVWTSGGSGYADAIVPALFGELAGRLEFVWANDRCTRRYDSHTLEYCDAKPLRKLRRRGYRLERVLVVDDSPEKHRQNYGNLVRVTPFLGDPRRRRAPAPAAIPRAPEGRAGPARGGEARVAQSLNCARGNGCAEMGYTYRNGQPVPRHGPVP